MKCQVNKKDNTRCDKESIIEIDGIWMCKQHQKTYLKNNYHQYGTCLDEESNILNLTIKEYLFNSKIRLVDLDG